MKGIYAIRDKRANTLYNETLDILADYRSLKAAWIDNLEPKKGVFYRFPEDFEIVKVGELNGNEVHIYEEYQIMDQLVDLLPKQ